MQRAFEKILSKLEELKRVEENREPDCNEEGYGDGEQIYDDGRSQGRYEQTNKIIEIVNQVASEYDGGWIPVSSGVMPEERQSIFAKFKGTDKWNDAMFEKISDEVNVTVVSEKGKATTTHAHMKDGKWSCDLLEVNKTYRVIAWQPLPKPYQPNICNDTDCPYNDKKECPASEGCAGYESEDKSI